MASIRITIETDGAAFQDPWLDARVVAEDIARSLRIIADAFQEYALPESRLIFRTGTPSFPVDANGNVLGTVEVID